MSKGTAITAIVIALAAGFVLGNLVGRGQGTDDPDQIAADDGNGGGEGAADGDRGAGGGGAEDGIERFRIPVTAAQPVKGPADALVTIVMFSDFQCPFCGRVEPTLTQIMNEYRGKVRIVWRNQPLPFHPNAGPAAELAAEAMAQGGSAKFWQVHDLMFQNQTNLDRAHLEQFATQAGLDMAKVRDALDHNTHQAEITADTTLGNQIGANGTPAFFINGRNLMGAQPVDAFKQIIDDEIARAERLVGTGVARNRVYAELTRNGKTQATPPAAAGAAPGQPPGGPQPPRRMPDPNAVYRVPVGDSPARGPADALVTIVMFSDFQCPFCGRVEPTLVSIREQYGNDVRIVWKNNPLPFHPNAGPSAELSMEAMAQGGSAKFWEAHDLLFQNQQAIERANLEQYATQLHLNVAAVRNALDNNTHQAQIQADMDLARNLGASGTPSFFINGRNLRGAQPLEAFKTIIDEELAKARQKVAAGTPRARVYEETIRNGATEAQTVEAPAAPPQPAAQPAPDADHVYNIPLNPRAPGKGAAHPRVVIQQFSDFQCPFCSRVEPTVNQILEQYGSQVKVVWRQFPLPFHEHAMPAAEASQEVLAQGGPQKFWAYHDLLFANQQSLDDAHLEQFAQQVGGIDMNRFRQAMTNHTHRAEVQADIDAVNNAGAQIGTPSFFINGRLVQGAQPFDAFKTAIDRAIAEAH